MTTSQKLWLGFGSLTALLALVCVAVLVRVRSVEGAVREQANVARPRSAATRELEINVVGYALAVRTFIGTDDPKFRKEAEEDAADVERHLADYERLATTERQRELAARFSTLWREYKDFGLQILNSKDRPLKRENSERLAVVHQFGGIPIFPPARRHQPVPTSFARGRSTQPVLRKSTSDP